MNKAAFEFLFTFLGEGGSGCSGQHNIAATIRPYHCVGPVGPRRQNEGRISSPNYFKFIVIKFSKNIYIFCDNESD